MSYEPIIYIFIMIQNSGTNNTNKTGTNKTDKSCFHSSWQHCRKSGNPERSQCSSSLIIRIPSIFRPVQCLHLMDRIVIFQDNIRAPTGKIVYRQNSQITGRLWRWSPALLGPDPRPPNSRGNPAKGETGGEARDGGVKNPTSLRRFYPRRYRYHSRIVTLY